MPTGVSIHSTPPKMGEDTRVREIEERIARYEAYYQNKKRKNSREARLKSTKCTSEDGDALRQLSFKKSWASFKKQEKV